MSWIGRAVGRALLAAVLAVALVGLTSTAAVAVDNEYVMYYSVTSAYQGKPENLTEIAERFLGDGARSAEVFALNTGRIQPDGAALTDGARLTAGWLLVLPWDAHGDGVRYGVLPGKVAAPPATTPGTTPGKTTPGKTTSSTPPPAGTVVRPSRECVTAALARSGERSRWAGRRLDAAQAWPRSRGRDQLVAIVDSGVDGSVRQLAGHVTTGNDLTSGGGRGDTDCRNTGTAMAGLIAAQPVKDGAVTGIAPDADVMPIRVVDKTPVTSVAASTAGIRAAVAAGASVIAVGSNVDLEQPEVTAAVNEAVDKGAVVVAGAPLSSAGPAPVGRFRDGVLRVGGVGRYGRPTVTYRSGSVDVVAPGVDVTSLGITGVGTFTGTGTRYAVAFVAGQAALIRSAYPHLSAAQVRNRILRTAEKMGSAGGPDARYGWGQIDLAASVTQVLPEEGRAAEAAAARAQAGRTGGLGSRVALLAIAGLVAVVAMVLLGRRIRRTVGAGARANQPSPEPTPTSCPALGAVDTIRTDAPAPAVLVPAEAASADAAPREAMRTEAMTGAVAELSRGPEPELSRDPALRHLAADEAGLAYLAETRPEAREKALIGLATGMDDDALAAMPAMAAALPGTDEQEHALTSILADVRRHVTGDADGLDRALAQAGKIRWQSQYPLSEHVMSFVPEHPELEQLSTRIADTRWSASAEPV